MATKGKKVEIYYTSQGTTAGIDSSALLFNGSDLTIHTHGKTFDGTNTWREVYVAGTKYFDSSVDGSAINFVAGPNASIGFIEAGTGEGQSGNINYASIVIDASIPANSIPTITAGKFLHANSTTGELEWIDDYNVKQTVNSTNQESPILLKNGTGNTEITSGTIYASGITVNPSTNSLSISGNLSVTGTASFSNNVTFNGTIDLPASGTQDLCMNNHNVNFKGSDPGDLVWYDDNDVEISRIWCGTAGSLNYRPNSSTNPYTLIHSGNISSYIGSYSWNDITGKPTLATSDTGVHISWAGELGYNDFTWLTAWTNQSKIQGVNKAVFAASGHGHSDLSMSNLSVINDNSQTSYDALAYFRHYSTNDWTIKTDDGGRDYGIYICNSGSNALKVDGNITCTNAYATSDRRLKKNIQKPQNLEELFNISSKLIKKFTWINTCKDSYGFIAQELEKWIPEAITTNDVDNYKTINYNIAIVKILAAVINEIMKIKISNL